MRGSVNIFISLLIVISTSGVFVSTHYCHNHLVSVAFFSNAEKCCNTDCPSCKNENHTFKVKTKVVPAETTDFSFINNVISLFNISSESAINFNVITDIDVLRIKPPPGNSYLPVYFSKLRL